MSGRDYIRIISITIIGCTAAAAALFFFRSMALEQKRAVSWRENFIPSEALEKSPVPKGWVVKNKPGTKEASFYIETDPETKSSYLRMEADNASATLIGKVDGVNIKKTPILRWRWRAITLPEGADGRSKAKDDQAIGIYVGTGGALSNKSISYRWDTATPKGAEGTSQYGLGFVKIKWYTLRNEKDAVNREWFTEERNVAEDFKNAWGFYPDKIYIAVSCNSQYTASRSVADLNWIEFMSTPVK